MSNEGVVPLVKNECSECSICYESFNSTHRITSLKCGHIFGETCVQQWLATEARCPKCNQYSVTGDLRLIYCNLDSEDKLIEVKRELEEIKNVLEMETKLRVDYETKFDQLVLNLGLKESEIDKLNDELEKRNELIQRINVWHPFKRLRTIDLRTTGCRSIVVSEILEYMIVSQATSPNSSKEEGFGVRLIPLNELKSSDFICLHKTEIHEMALHPNGRLLLTASVRQIKVVNLANRQQLSCFNFKPKVCCLSWNLNSVEQLYVGLEDGHLVELDYLKKKVAKKFQALPCSAINEIFHSNYDGHEHSLLINQNRSFFTCNLKENRLIKKKVLSYDDLLNGQRSDEFERCVSYQIDNYQQSV